MGERGMPRMKAPSAPLYTISGAWQRPSPVNNVETIATVPAILSMAGRSTRRSATARRARAAPS
jgi:NADH:ubiquinone oxidoreductase subunit F (NADH-binding)